MRTNNKSDENFETLRNAINEAILKNKKVAKILEKIKEDNMLPDLCNYELILKLRKIVNRFQQKKRVKIKSPIV
jgi:hypothetical protein